MKNDITYMDCWHLIAPLIPVNSDFCQSIYVMVFQALKRAGERSVADHIVRCRDCVYRQGDKNPMCMVHTEPHCNARGYKGEAVCVEMDDFCSCGKRRCADENHS